VPVGERGCRHAVSAVSRRFERERSPQRGDYRVVALWFCCAEVWLVPCKGAEAMVLVARPTRYASFPVTPCGAWRCIAASNAISNLDRRNRRHRTGRLLPAGSLSTAEQRIRRFALPSTPLRCRPRFCPNFCRVASCQFCREPEGHARRSLSARGESHRVPPAPVPCRPVGRVAGAEGA
jgi:hypothetical protein